MAVVCGVACTRGMAVCLADIGTFVPLQELVESLGLPDELKRRVWTVFPRTAFGSQPLQVRSVRQRGAFHAPVDPWGLLEHVPQLPSDALVPALDEKVVRRRRVFRYV